MVSSVHNLQHALRQFAAEYEMDRWCSAALAVMLAFYGTIVGRRGLSRKDKLSIYQSIYVPPSPVVISFG